MRWELKPSLCSNPPILFRSAVQIQGNVLPSQSLWPHSALPAEPRDSPSLKDTVTLTLSPSMSLARTKAIWGAAESFSNKITLSICTLHGSDCRALRSPIPRLLLDLLRSSNPGLHDWLQLKAPHARGGSQKHCETQKRPPAHQTKLHSLKAMGNRENEKEGSEREEKKKVRIKRKTSHCTPSVIHPDKRTNYISASWHPRVKIGIGSLSALFVWEHVDIGSISSHKRAREVHRPTFQPFILASFVFRYTRVCVCCLSPLLGGIDCYYSKQHYLY